MKSAPFLLALLASGICSAADPAVADGQAAFFERKIRPVLVEKCYDCHSAQAGKSKGGLRLDTREAALLGGDHGPAVVPGDPEESLLIAAIRHGNPDMEMPPKGRLPDSVIADFETWVKMGAPDPRESSAAAASSAWEKKEINLEEGRKFWAFQPPKATPQPAVKNASWPKAALDFYVLARLEEKGLQPAPDASRLELLRRVTFDLTGLPPTPDLIQAYLKDTSAGALAKVVDSLLASERFGEHWGRHWLDVARYGESAGREANVLYPFAWRYRDWVISAFNRDLPYDEFVKQQIAGDLLPFKDAADQSGKIVATGFLAIGSKPHNERNARQFALEVADEQIDTFSQAFLGITIACARCHDHKFDPIPQKDYYALAGIFLSSETLYGTSNAVQNNHPSDLIDLGAASGMPAGFEGISPAEHAALAQRVARMREDQQETTRAAVTARRGGKEADVFKLLVMRQQIGALTGQMERYEENGSPRILAMGVYDRRRPVNSPVFDRGEAAQPGAMVPRGLVQVMFPGRPPEITQGSGRLDLAKWIASRENPQTARVMVNRMWRWLFGRGLVATVDNFGAMGEKPSHPELLDHLALRFMEQGWSIKKMVREIILSRTYQLGTTHVPQNFAADPDNTLFWRMNSRAVSAESLRDAMLLVSGRLNLHPEAGSPVCRAGEGREGLISLFTSMQQPRLERSVYLPVVRDMVPEVLSLFDFANPSLVTGDRENTIVPAQSLYLLNNQQVQDLSDAFARRVYDSARDQPGRITQAFWMALGRPPTAEEIRAGYTFFSEYAQDADKARGKGGAATGLSLHAWSAFCQALMASAEFRYLN